MTRAAAAPVRIEVISPSNFVPTLDLFGEVGPNSRHPIQTPMAGRLVFRPRFSQGLRAGETVAAGEPLLEIVNEQLELQVVEARLELKAAATELESARKGVAGGFLAEIELRKAEVSHELAEERLASIDQRQARSVVRAPVRGFLIVDQTIAPGTEVEAGATVGWVGGEGPERIEGFVATRDLETLVVGQTVECRRPGGEVVATAEITEIPRQVDAGGTATVIARVVESYALPPAGEGLELRVLLTPIADAIHAPKSAILHSAGVASVFVLTPSGEEFQVERRPVRLGGSSSERVQIVDGLRAGETIATSGIELLSDGALARDAERKSNLRDLR